MALDLASILNNWNQMGMFSIVFPFLIIFAIVFAILQKTKIFGDSANEQTKNVYIFDALKIHHGKYDGQNRFRFISV